MDAGERATAEKLKALLIPLTKLALAPDEGEAAHWRNEIATAHKVAAGLSPDEHTERALATAWPLAIEKAEADRHVLEGTTRVSYTLPQICPLPITALLGADADIETLTRQIRQSTATG